MRDPWSLKCSHAYCGECLVSLFKAAGSGKAQCPQCRRPTDRRAKQRDPVMVSLVQKYRALHRNLSRALAGGDGDVDDLDMPAMSQETHPEPNPPCPDFSLLPAAVKPPLPFQRALFGRQEKQPAPSSSSSSSASPSPSPSPTPPRAAPPPKKRAARPKPADEAAANAEVVSPSKSQLRDGEPVGPACSFCVRPDDEEEDPLRECSRCGVLVHATCYGLAEDTSSQFVCHPCAAAPKKKPPPCVLCPDRRDRALTTTNDGRYVHTSCALWHAETEFEDRDARTRCDVSRVPPERLRLKCFFCKRRGACLQCSYGRCTVSFHVPCGFRGGARFELRSGVDGDDRVFFHAFCLRHRDMAAATPSNNAEPAGAAQRRKRKSAGASSSSSSSLSGAKRRRRRRGGVAAPGEPARPPVLMATKVNEQEHQLGRLAKLLGGRLVSDWSEEVTHVVTSATLAGGSMAANRTFKYLMGLAAGQHVVCLDWAEACLSYGEHVLEEAFWVRGDKFTPAAVRNDPRSCVGQRAATAERRLLDGFQVVFDGIACDTSDLRKLVRCAGGEVRSSPMSAAAAAAAGLTPDEARRWVIVHEDDRQGESVEERFRSGGFCVLSRSQFLMLFSSYQRPGAELVGGGGGRK